MIKCNRCKRTTNALFEHLAYTTLTIERFSCGQCWHDSYHTSALTHHVMVSIKFYRESLKERLLYDMTNFIDGDEPEYDSIYIDMHSVGSSIIILEET